MSQNPISKSVRSMGYNEWFDTFKPVENHFNPTEGAGFETYGQELEFVKSQPFDRVWTLLDGSSLEDDLKHLADEDDFFDNTLITSGVHLVNRLKYYVTQVPCPEGITIDVYDEHTLELLKLHQGLNGVH